MEIRKNREEHYIAHQVIKDEDIVDEICNEKCGEDGLLLK